MAVPEEAISAIQAQGGVTEGGRVYGQVSGMVEFIPEARFFQNNSHRYSASSLNWLMEHTSAMKRDCWPIMSSFVGWRGFALDQLTLLEGDLNKLKEPGGNFIAAVYREDDYGDPMMDSNWAQIGDTVTIWYIDEFEYYDNATGQPIPIDQVDEAYAEGRSITSYAKTYREVNYTVAALVTVPRALSYRYYGDDAFILNDQTFIRDSGTNSIMYYAFDTTAEASAAMETFLTDYTKNVDPALDYESKGTYTGEFESMRSMFLLLGGTLSFIVGLVGVLNFANAILTGITARRRELAVLQSIGMTSRQTQRSTVFHADARGAALQTLGAVVLALALTLLTAPALSAGLESLFWFFTYRLTLWPIGAVTALLCAAGRCRPCRQLSCRPAHSGGGTTEGGIKVNFPSKCKKPGSLLKGGRRALCTISGSTFRRKPKNPEPFSNRKQVRIFLVWWTWRDSNP